MDALFAIMQQIQSMQVQQMKDKGTNLVYPYLLH